MNKHSNNQLSATRQKISSIKRELSRLIEDILSSRSGIKGTICEKKRKCGNSKCRCVHGELHKTTILSYSDKGRSRIIHLSKYSELELIKLQKQVKEYQQFRRNRAKIVYYFKLLITEINRMERYLVVESAPPRKGVDHESQEQEEGN